MTLVTYGLSAVGKLRDGPPMSLFSVPYSCNNTPLNNTTLRGTGKHYSKPTDRIVFFPCWWDCDQEYTRGTDKGTPFWPTFSFLTENTSTLEGITMLPECKRHHHLSLELLRQC